MKYATYEAHITNIAVLPPYQNLGLGQMLIKTLIDEADKRGLRKVSLEVRQSNVNAHEAYRFAGFVDRIVKKTTILTVRQKMPSKWFTASMPTRERNE